jgi:alkaline phosphatase D
VPTGLADYRALYRGYLADPDLQDARARWPFVCMWDNHEFSWKGWQSQQNFGGVRPAQTRKMAANQAWFEYQPARVVKAGPAAVDRFTPPAVEDRPIGRFDDHGLGLEPGNLAAIESLKLFRALRFGANVELILTDPGASSSRSSESSRRSAKLPRWTGDSSLVGLRPEASLEAGDRVVAEGRCGGGAGRVRDRRRFPGVRSPRRRSESPAVAPAK